MKEATLYIRLIAEPDKGAMLAKKIAMLREGRRAADVHAVDPASFRQVPNTPFCYWVSERIRHLFTELPPFESKGRTVKQGLATADDFRFVRAWWEAPAERILDSGEWEGFSEQCPVSRGRKSGDGGEEEKWSEERMRAHQEWCRRRTAEGKRWVPFAKGGEYSLYYADIHLVVNWECEGKEIRNFTDPLTGKTNSRPQNTDYYFRPGLTWTYRTNAGFSVRSKPANTIHGHVGHSAFIADDIQPFLAWFNSSAIASGFLRLLTTYKWEVGYVQKLPVPFFPDNTRKQLKGLAFRAGSLSRTLDTVNETSHAFILPALLQASGATLGERAAVLAVRIAETEAELSNIQAEIDEIAFNLYGFSEEERRAVSGSMAMPTEERAEAEEGEAEPENEAEVPAADGRDVAAALPSWCVGAVFGRFDIRLAQDSTLAPAEPDPFDPLPACPPGMLQGPDGLPFKPGDVPSNYSIRIGWDGILVDDPEHEDDIVRRVRDVLEAIWKERAEAIEREACEILGVRELRDYFHKPGNGGFWMDHVKRYSKSRRKAPIYWYLRSARGNYGLWLYYHRLDKDILFKALLNYVEPKIRLEEDRLKTLRVRKEAAGSSGREAKQIEKDIDRQDQLVSELHDFADKLRRAANLHLEPDLNDGVVLNIAPLWELVPWKEAKEYWEDLVEGKYEWSSIALQLWPERVKELCKKDRSIAIAHGLEHLCEVEPAKIKRSIIPKEADSEEVLEDET